MRFSIVIPTHQRRDIVVANVSALERQDCRDFEVVVVVDGSADGTAAALRSLSPTFPLTVVEQDNLGAAQARNVGAARAAGDILVFLDDDMEADPSLLREHDRSHRAGAVLVLGDVPLHPGSPSSVLTRAVASWASARRDRLTASATAPALEDLLTGQMSITRAAFEQLGGFDAALTRGGLFGGEDIDFGYRVTAAGYPVVYNPDAISHQRYDVDPGELLRREYEAGRAAEELAAKHPERTDELGRQPSFRSRRDRLLLGPLVVVPPAVTRPLRAGVAGLVRRGSGGRRLWNAFVALRTVERRRGARDARRRLATGSTVVLAYHAIADLRADPVLRDYGVPPDRFAAHLDALTAHGCTFIDLDSLLGALDGDRRLPDRAVLVTFDDGYTDLLTAAAPILAERRIPAIVFAVAGRVGQTNEWDRANGAGPLPLLDAEGLRALEATGIEVGSHGQLHRPLAGLDRDALRDEVEGSAAAIEALGLSRPRVLSYPHGVWDAAAVEAVHRAGYAAAFTVEPGAATGAATRYTVPRIEALAGDTPRSLWLKVATARWPAPVRRRFLRAALRAGSDAEH